jgi:Uma2 family endonuclease
MSAVAPPSGPLIGREEFDRMQAVAERGVRLERMDGYVYAMAGAGLAHERMVARLIVMLDGPARSKGCEVVGSNRRLSIGEHNDFLPDIAVYCDPTDDDDYAGLRPCLVVEVLSRSTAVDDLNLKLPRYKHVPSLEAILFVNPAPLYAELFVRSGESWQQQHLVDADDQLALPCPPTVLRLGDLVL